MGRRRFATRAACAALLLLLLGLTATACAIHEGACIVEIKVKGDLGLQGTATYTERYESDSSDAMRKATVRVPLKGAKAAVAGVIPVVFPPGTTCRFSSTATNKDDPGYPALVAALAGAKIGTDKEPKFKLRTGEIRGTFKSGNPDSESERASYLVASYAISNITLDMDLIGTGAALKPGGSKTFKTAVVFAGGAVDGNVEYQRGIYGSSWGVSLDLESGAKVKKSSGCKVALKSGAFSLSCASLNLALDAITDGDEDAMLTAKVVLKGGALAGTGSLAAAKPFNSTSDDDDA